MDFQSIATGLSVLISLWALYESRIARKTSDQNLEKDEIRRRKVEIIYALLGSRYVLSDAYQPSANEVKVFNTSMALFTVFFAHNPEVVRAYDTFQTIKTDENLVRLLHTAAKSQGLELLDSSIKTVLTVKAAPAVVVSLPFRIEGLGPNTAAKNSI